MRIAKKMDDTQFTYELYNETKKSHGVHFLVTRYLVSKVFLF
ncbi:hypothetical protein ACOBV8_13410 [Pseudoalteromonas espejiana]